MDNKIMAVIVVAIVVIAAVGVGAYALTNNNSDKSDDVTIDAAVSIYGNANNDAYIDNDDVEFIQSIIDGKTAWDKTKNPYADAYKDGVIDSKDVDLVKKIINNESTKIWYHNYFGEDQQINYPLSGKKIACTMWQQAEAASILGLWDNVVVANKSCESMKTLYPETHSDGTKVKYIGSAGSSKIGDYVTDIVGAGTEVIIATPSTGNVKQYTDQLTNIDTIFLWYTGSYAVPTILTLGVMFDKEDQAEAYAKFYQQTINSITEKVAGLSDRPTVITNITYGANEATREASNNGVCVMLTDDEGCHYLLKYLANVVTDIADTSWGYSYRDTAWFVQHQSAFDYIINFESGIAFYDKDTPASYNTAFESSLECFKSLNAYSQGKILGSTYSFFGGFAGVAMLPIMAYMLYPDLFDEKEVQSTLQYWFDHFTASSGIDVSSGDFGGYYYTGTKYTPTYMKG